MDRRLNDGLVIGGAAVVLVCVVALSAMWRTEFKTPGSWADWILAGCAGIGVLTSLFGLFLLRNTLRANRQMAEAAFQSIEDTIWLRRKEKRPTMNITRIGFSQEIAPRDGTFKLYCEIENLGQSDAWDVSIHVKVNQFRSYAGVRKHLQRLHSVERSLPETVDIARVRPIEKQVVSRRFEEPSDGWKRSYAIFEINYGYRYAVERTDEYRFLFAVDLSPVRGFEERYNDTPDGEEWYISGNLAVLFGQAFHD